MCFNRVQFRLSDYLGKLNKRKVEEGENDKENIDILCCDDVGCMC